MGRIVGFTDPDPDDGIGIGAGLGARKDGVSRPEHSSRIEAATKLGARWVAGLADRDRDAGGPGIRDEGAVEKWLLCLLMVGVAASICTDGIGGFKTSLLSSRNTRTSWDWASS